jgi:hypothetical protein
MATVGEIQSHQTVVGTHQGLIDLQIGRTATQTLDVDTPFGGVQVEGLKGTHLASQFDGIDMLVTTVVTGTRVTLRVLVGHGRAQSIEDSTGGEVLGGNQDNRLALTLDLFFLRGRGGQQLNIDIISSGAHLPRNCISRRTYHDLSNFRIRLSERLLEELQSISQYGGVIDLR